MSSPVVVSPELEPSSSVVVSPPSTSFVSSESVVASVSVPLPELVVELSASVVVLELVEVSVVAIVVDPLSTSSDPVVTLVAWLVPESSVDDEAFVELESAPATEPLELANAAVLAPVEVRDDASESSGSRMQAPETKANKQIPRCARFCVPMTLRTIARIPWSASTAELSLENPHRA